MTNPSGSSDTISNWKVLRSASMSSVVSILSRSGMPLISGRPSSARFCWRAFQAVTMTPVRADKPPPCDERFCLFAVVSGFSGMTTGE